MSNFLLVREDEQTFPPREEEQTTALREEEQTRRESSRPWGE